MLELGKIFAFIGIVFLLIGMLMNMFPHFPKLPGDIYVEKPGIKIYIPVASSLIVSIVLSIIFNFFR